MIKAISIAIGLLIGVVFSEMALRLIGIEYPIFYERDIDGISRHRPGMTGVFSKEGRANIKINSDGLRDREHALLKPESTRRIAVLGDSYAEAFQVDLPETFWSVMERELQKCKSLAHRKVEVLNFGVSGYGTGSELLRLQRDVWKYDPDIILVAFLTGNDIKNNSYVLEKNSLLNYFRVVDGKLYLSAPQEITASQRYKLLADLWRSMVDHSRVLQVTQHVRLNYKTMIPGLRSAFVGDSAKHPDGTLSDSSSEAGLDDYIYSSPTNEDWKAAWEVTEKILLEMKREVTSRDKTLFVATLSNAIQVDPDAAKRTAYAHRLGVDDLYYPDRRIIDFVTNEKIPSMMLAPELLDWAEKNSTCVHGFSNAQICGGHWNQHGHRLAGDIVSREICRQIIDRR